MRFRVIATGNLRVINLYTESDFLGFLGEPGNNECREVDQIRDQAHLDQHGL